MFLNKLLENNQELIKCAFDLHQKGLILPDTYLLDYDTIKENAIKMVEKANGLNIDLYFMLKQIGRNPLIGKMLMEVGFKGCVAVDYKEALVMIDNDIHISNVGHLVQVPHYAMKKIIASKVDYVTIYSKDILIEINEASKRQNIIQKVLIRITDDDANLYSGQVAGIKSNELKEYLQFIETLDNVSFGGLTVFPALLFNSNEKQIIKTDNIKGLERAKQILNELAYQDYMINLPSASCVASFDLINELGGKSAEPGHGLTGTTPLHVISNQLEKVGYCYVSEISHNYNNASYCYGGGHYRRGHMANCLVGTSLEDCKKVNIKAPDDDSIDYHYEIDANFKKGLTCVMCYRTQVFTTRSDVVVVKGIKENKYQILGYYDSLGKKIKRYW